MIPHITSRCALGVPIVVSSSAAIRSPYPLRWALRMAASFRSVCDRPRVPRRADPVSAAPKADLIFSRGPPLNQGGTRPLGEFGKPNPSGQDSGSVGNAAFFAPPSPGKYFTNRGNLLKGSWLGARVSFSLRRTETTGTGQLKMAGELLSGLARGGPNGLEPYLPKELGPLDDPQTALPRIARDAALSRRIESAVRRVPTAHTLYLGDVRKLRGFKAGSVQLLTPA